MDITDDYTGPDSGFDIVANDRNFMDPSSASKFKVLPSTAGVVAIWHDFATGHSHDGTQLWRYDARPLGGQLSITPDGRHVATLTTDGELLVLDVATGAVVHSRQLGTDHPDSFEVLADGTLCVLQDGELRLFDPLGEPLRAHRPYNTGTARELVPLAGPYAGQVVTGDHGDWARVDPRTGEKLATFQSADEDRWLQLLGTWTSPIVVRDDGTEIAILDPFDLTPTTRIPFTGLKGVQRESRLAAGDTNYTKWELRATLSYDGALLAVIDEGGLARVFDPQNGRLLRRLPHSLVDHPYDLTWLGEPGEFVAIVDGGRLVRMKVDGGAPIWTAEVFTDADRERFYVDTSEGAETIDAVLAAELLDTLASTRSLSEYSHTAARLSHGPALDTWGEVLTPQRTYGLLRSQYWMLQAGGFTEQDELRQLWPQIDAAAGAASAAYQDAAGRLGWLITGQDVPLAAAGDWEGSLRWTTPFTNLASAPGLSADASAAGSRVVEILDHAQLLSNFNAYMRDSARLYEPLLNLVTKLPYGATLLLVGEAMKVTDPELAAQVAGILRQRFGGPEIESFIATLTNSAQSGGITREHRP